MNFFTAGNLIVCKGTADDPCTFQSLIKFVNILISDLTVLATLATVVGLVIVGFNLLRAQGKPGALSDAKNRAGKLLIGYFLILAAWLIVYTISHTLLKPEFILLQSQ